MSPGLLAAKLILGPLLLLQARRLRKTALRLPEAAGPRQGQAGTGSAQLQLLVVGDSSAAGVGVDLQSQALAQPLALALAQRLDARVGWQLIARTGIDTAAAQGLLQEHPPAPADIVVVALGVNDVSAQVSAAGFVQRLAGLWISLREQTGARWAVFSGLPPMQLLTALPQPLRWYLGRYAAWLDLALQRWTRDQQLGYCPLRWATDARALARDGFHPGPSLYPRWAAELAEQIVQGRARWAN
jgi:lysophospholipase L1-like esterase